VEEVGAPPSLSRLGATPGVGPTGDAGPDPLLSALPLSHSSSHPVVKASTVQATYRRISSEQGPHPHPPAPSWTAGQSALPTAPQVGVGSDDANKSWTASVTHASQPAAAAPDETCAERQSRTPSSSDGHGSAALVGPEAGEGGPATGPCVTPATTGAAVGAATAGAEQVMVAHNP
jgi:hypothetical protein